MRTETTGNAFQMRRLGERDVDAKRWDIGKCSSAWTRGIRRASRFGGRTGLRCCERTAIS